MKQQANPEETETNKRGKKPTWNMKSLIRLRRQLLTTRESSSSTSTSSTLTTSSLPPHPPDPFVVDSAQLRSTLAQKFFGAISLDSCFDSWFRNLVKGGFWFLLMKNIILYYLLNSTFHPLIKMFAENICRWMNTISGRDG